MVKSEDFVRFNFNLKIIEAQINTCFRKEFLPGIFLVFGIGYTV